jgi:hypothetical protein
MTGKPGCFDSKKIDDAPDPGTKFSPNPGCGFPGEKGKIIQALKRN